MSHPFTRSAAKGLRERVGLFVHSGLHRTAATNIVFVCGGDQPDHLRPRFIEYMKVNMPSYRPFRPEAAQADFFEQDHADTLNLSAFEELVSDLSLGIVLFAESPGSYAETGLFSALENARKKTLVVMNVDLQGPGSFLSFGPVAVISSKSRMGPAIHISYTDPNFNIIMQRIEDRLKIPNSFRSIGDKDFSQLESIEIMALTWFYVDLLRACSLEDLVFCFNSAFRGHAGSGRIKQILSVLVGSQILCRSGPLGLVRVSDQNVKLASPSTSKAGQLQGFHLEITDLLDAEGDPNYLEAIVNVA